MLCGLSDNGERAILQQSGTHAGDSPVNVASASQTPQWVTAGHRRRLPEEQQSPGRARAAAAPSGPGARAPSQLPAAHHGRRLPCASDRSLAGTRRSLQRPPRSPPASRPDGAAPPRPHRQRREAQGKRPNRRSGASGPRSSAAPRRLLAVGRKSRLRAGGLYHTDGEWGGLGGLEGLVPQLPTAPSCTARLSRCPEAAAFARTGGRAASRGPFQSPRPVPPHPPPSWLGGCARARPGWQGQVPAEDGVSRAAGARRRFLPGRGERGLAAGAEPRRRGLSPGSGPPRRRGSLAEAEAMAPGAGQPLPCLAFLPLPASCGDLRRPAAEGGEGSGCRPRGAGRGGFMGSPRPGGRSSGLSGPPGEAI